MRQEFLGYYFPTEKEFESLWSECTFVFDANMLINLYRFPKDSREAMLKIMENIKDRIWIPHQVALDYHKNLHGEIYNQKKAYDNFKDRCNVSINELINELSGLRHSNIESAGIEKILKQCLEDIAIELSNQRELQPDLVEIQNKVIRLIGNNIGVPFTPEKLEELYAIGDVRYQAKVPPGYKDLNEKKGETTLHNGITYKDEFGDFIYWRQILDKASEEVSIKSIILVTDDSKEDWVYKVKGEKKGPHPELIHEFQKECNGKQFYLYNSERFLEYAKGKLNLDDSYLDEGEVTGAIQGIKELKKLDDNLKFSNQKNNVDSSKSNQLILDSNLLNFFLNNEENNYINSINDYADKVTFTLSLEGKLDPNELSIFTARIKSYMVMAFKYDIQINYKYSMDVGGRYYGTFDIIGLTTDLLKPIMLKKMLSDIATVSFISKKPNIVINDENSEDGI